MSVLPEPGGSERETTQEERRWHYALDETAYGPTTASDLAEMASRGVVDADTLVWREGWEQWRAAGEAEELRGVLPVAQPGRREPEGPAVMSAPSPVPTPSVPDGAALRRCSLRLAAAVIDQVIVFVPTMVVVLPVLVVMIARGMTVDQVQRLTPVDVEWWLVFLSAWVTQWVYASITESSVLMGTIGKRLCGLRVTDLHGRRLTFGRASARYWSKVLSTPFFLGYAVAVLFGGRRGLHDLVSGTMVSEAPRRR